MADRTMGSAAGSRRCHGSGIPRNAGIPGSKGSASARSGCRGLWIRAMKASTLQWTIAAMLFLATTINYLDRLALSMVSRTLRVEFAMSEQDYSHVVTIFLLAYAIMYAGSGYLVDRLGTRRGFALFISIWSIAA